MNNYLSHEYTYLDYEYTYPSFHYYLARGGRTSSKSHVVKITLRYMYVKVKENLQSLNK